MEHKLLSMVLHSREVYDRASTFFDDDDFSETGLIVYGAIKQYYEKDPEATCVDPELLADNVVRAFPKFEDRFRNIIAGLHPVSAPNVMNELLEAKLGAVRTQLATALVNNSDVDDLIDEFNRLRAGQDTNGEEQDTFNGTDILSILTHTDTSNRIQLLPHALNRRCGGGAWRGAHIFLYARPNAGKTLFAINLAMGFIKQDLRVLYLGNEDATIAMVPRFVSNLTEIPLKELVNRHDEAVPILEQRGFNNLYWRHLNPGTIGEIDLAIQEVSPDVVIVDQLINLDAGRAEGVAAMDYLAKQLRRLYIRHNVLGISIGQAGDSATGKAVLKMEDVYGSKTAIQAATDLMVGLGSDDVLSGIGQAMVSITKNKLGPIHEAFAVRMDTTINKVRSL